MKIILKLKKKVCFIMYVWVEVSNKRKLEIEVFIYSIYNEMNKLQDKYEKICFLIDQQYKEHTGIFDHEKSGFIFKEQYSGLIFDILQKKINEISKTSIEVLRNPVKSTIKKTLVWKAQKNTIGTLFGVLYKNGFIKGNKTDIVRGLTDMFDNLSKDSLIDNINLKKYEIENKIKHDKKTIELLSEWVKHLKK